MRMWFLRVLTVCIISGITGVFGISFSNDYFHTMFTIISIMFSISLNQIFSFSFSCIPNNDFTKRYRTHLLDIQNIYFVIFIFAVIIFFLSSRYTKPLTMRKIVLSPNCLFGCFDLFFLFYFVINLKGLVKLKNEIDDLIREQE